MSNPGADSLDNQLRRNIEDEGLWLRRIALEVEQRKCGSAGPPPPVPSGTCEGLLRLALLAEEHGLEGWALWWYVEIAARGHEVRVLSPSASLLEARAIADRIEAEADRGEDLSPLFGALIGQRAVGRKSPFFGRRSPSLSWGPYIALEELEALHATRPELIRLRESEEMPHEVVLEFISDAARLGVSMAAARPATNAKLRDHLLARYARREPCPDCGEPQAIEVSHLSGFAVFSAKEGSGLALACRRCGRLHCATFVVMGRPTHSYVAPWFRLTKLTRMVRVELGPMRIDAEYPANTPQPIDRAVEFIVSVALPAAGFAPGWRWNVAPARTAEVLESPGLSRHELVPEEPNELGDEGARRLAAWLGIGGIWQPGMRSM